MTQELSQVNQDIKLLHAALQRLDIHGLTTGDLKSYSLIEVDINQDYKNWVSGSGRIIQVGPLQTGRVYAQVSGNM